MLLESTAQYNIRHLARTLVEDWKVMVDEWITESTPESMKASVVDEDEGGLPFPPLDDLAFFATQTTSIEFSQFFDGMDGDGNLQNSEASLERNGRKASLERKNPARKEQFSKSITAAPKDRKGEQQKKQTSVFKTNKPSGGDSGPGRLTKPTSKRKLNKDDMKLLKKSHKGKIQKRPVSSQQNKLKCSDEDATRMKLEAIKKKLQELYEEAEKAKRQQTIQVIELHDIPKQGLCKQGSVLKNAHLRLGNHNRHWTNGCR